MNMLLEQVASSSAALPVAYERACQTLADCVALDECRDWADKAAALASYARQADDKTLENYAMRIRARAVRRAGELLNEFDGKGRNQYSEDGGGAPTTQRQAAEEAGMSKDRQVQAVRVAKVPLDQFEAAIDGEEPATITSLAEAGRSPRPVERPPGFAEATQFIGSIGRLADFCAVTQPGVIAGALLPHEIDDARLKAGVVQDWLWGFAKEVQNARPTGN